MELVRKLRWRASSTGSDREMPSLANVISEAGLTKGFVVGMFSDHFYTGIWENLREEILQEHAEYQLECIRVFDEKHELKIYKSGQRFFYRDSYCYQVSPDPDEAGKETDDGKKLIVNSMEEKQLLDIDKKATKGLSAVYATGGGCYSLEGSGFTNMDVRDANAVLSIVLEDYICYYESGQAYVYDWRIVRFEKGKEKRK